MLMTIITFLIVLSVLVVVHEFGHFYAARKSGMTVHEFGLGFPPRLFSFTDKHGTEWTINLIPLGGFVRIKGESGDDRDQPDSFSGKSFFARLITLSGGVIMNFILAAVLFSVGFLIGIPSIVDGDLPNLAKSSEEKTVIVQSLEGAQVTAGEILTNEDIVSVNDIAVYSAGEIRDQLQIFATDSQSATLAFENGSSVTLEPQYLEEIGRDGYGLAFADTALIRYPWYIAPFKGLETAFAYLLAIIAAFYGLIRDLILGSPVPEAVSGPVGIATMTGEVARQGIQYLIQFTAVLSLNLAVLNALPFPALDGGRIAFLLLEKLRGKPASEKVEGMAHALGFTLLMILVVIVTYRDIVRVL